MNLLLNGSMMRLIKHVALLGLAVTFLLSLLSIWYRLDYTRNPQGSIENFHADLKTEVYDIVDRNSELSNSRNEQFLTSLKVTSVDVTTLSSAINRESSPMASITKPLQSATTHSTTANATTPSSTKIAGDKVIVMGKRAADNTTWVDEELPDWQNAIYVVDNTSAQFHTTANKGHEALPYLTYIIDNWATLPSTLAFIHSHRDGYPQAWHTDNPAHSNVVSLRSLNIPFVQRNGYANLRCNPAVGCPDEIQPFREPKDSSRTAELQFENVWPILFGDSPLPHTIATPCCAQFAVAKWQIKKRSLRDYVRFQTWVLETPLDDAVAGRILEYLWHIIFGQEPVYCPPISQCYCDVYNDCAALG